MKNFKTHLEDSLNEAKAPTTKGSGNFTNTVSTSRRDLDMVRDHGVDAGGKEVESFSFETRKEALKHRREMVKKYGLTKYSGIFSNFSKGLELSSSY